VHLLSLHRIRANHRTNINLDPYDPNCRCSICGMAYSSRGAYLQHLRKIHAMKIPHPNNVVFDDQITLDISDPNFHCRSYNRGVHQKICIPLTLEGNS
jgi:hypothetical protein